jgi:sulfopyruvate decarboxylase subunit alpha
MSEAAVKTDPTISPGVSAARGIERLEPDIVAYMPSNIVAPLVTYLQGRAKQLLVIAREEEAVGIVGGAALAGSFGVIIMQDNGFGNALTALSTFTVAYHLPLLIVANTRGGLGEYNSMIHTISENVPTILRAIDIPVFHLDRTHSIPDWEQTVFEAGRHAAMTHRPVVVLMDFWGTEGSHE